MSRPQAGQRVTLAVMIMGCPRLAPRSRATGSGSTAAGRGFSWLGSHVGRNRPHPGLRVATERVRAADDTVLVDREHGTARVRDDPVLVEVPDGAVLADDGLRMV